MFASGHSNSPLVPWGWFLSCSHWCHPGAAFGARLRSTQSFMIDKVMVSFAFFHPWPWLCHEIPGMGIPSIHPARAACRQFLLKHPILPKAGGVDKINPFLGLTYHFLRSVSSNSIYLFPSFHGSKIKNLTFVHLPWLVSAAIKHHCASTHRMLSKVFEANQSVSFSPMAVS